ncbi:MAG: hypothetical protein NTV38_07425 [Chloroflexi bacterium]|nr:hypothetical protein [Chloroflexota bacterium]
MKIIDHTPFFKKETGEISILDRGKAMMKYGANWINEVEAQKQVIPVLGKVLDRNYTLLRNITPPGLEASFPFILVGPTGVFVMYVTPLTGLFRAKGDQWGTISGNAFKNEKPNLLTRTERMARAIQVFLERQGYLEITSVDAILLCSDLSVHVDSIRPIIRVVMRDALERFAISITQARVVLSPESVQDVIGRILNPPKPTPPQPAETLAAAGSEALPSARAEDPYVPTFALPESQAPAWSNEPDSLSIAGTETHSRVPRHKGLNKKQWAFLIVMFVIWCLLITVFLFLVLKDQWSFLLSLLP